MQIFEGTNQIQRLVIARSLAKARSTITDAHPHSPLSVGGRACRLLACGRPPCAGNGELVDVEIVVHPHWPQIEDPIRQAEHSNSVSGR